MGNMIHPAKIGMKMENRKVKTCEKRKRKRLYRITFAAFYDVGSIPVTKILWP
jgi:CRISPR/Cas system CMR-associated protein Cmr3 (group 5 of RAMP superfamily)